MTELMTIERHILEQERLVPDASGVFTNLMYDIALVAKVISQQTIRAGLVDILGTTGSTNVQGEEQKELDVFADDTIVSMMNHTGRLCIMASEEHAEAIEIPEEYEAGPYSMLFDPLDGSSNIGYNSTIGTIFGIHRKVSEGERGTIGDLLQPGYKQVAAGYVLYGYSTMLVYATEFGVHGFTLDPSIGEFLLSHPNIRIPDEDGYYSANPTYRNNWSRGVQRFHDWLVGEDPEDLRDGLPMRYIGALVADFHRTLLTGGMYMYPAEYRDEVKSNGKLRLSYECAPLAFIAEKAGGYASDGVGPILNIQPTDLHQRVPFFVGNRRLVEKAEEFVDKYDSAWIAEYDRVEASPEPA